MLTDKYLDGIPQDSRAAENTLALARPADRADARRRSAALNEIARGRGQTLAQMALAWTLRDARMTSTLIGASSVAQLDDSLGALDNLDFSDDELAEIDRYATESDINLWARSQRALNRVCVDVHTNSGYTSLGDQRAGETISN